MIKLIMDAAGSETKKARRENPAGLLKIVRATFSALPLACRPVSVLQRLWRISRFRCFRRLRRVSWFRCFSRLLRGRWRSGQLCQLIFLDIDFVVLLHIFDELVEHGLLAVHHQALGNDCLGLFEFNRGPLMSVTMRIWKPSFIGIGGLA